MIHSIRANEQSRCSSQGHVRHHASELDGAQFPYTAVSGCFAVARSEHKFIELVERKLSGAAHCFEHTWLQAGMIAHHHDGTPLHSTLRTTV